MIFDVEEWKGQLEGGVGGVRVGDGPYAVEAVVVPATGESR